MSGKRTYASTIAILIMSEGFKAAAAKFDITPQRARDILDFMRKSGVEDDKVPKELVELAAKLKAFGHRRSPPVTGEERSHKATRGGRVSVYGQAIGIKAGTEAKVAYERDRIVVTKPGKRGKQT